MHILIITYIEYPSYDGLRERVHNFAKELSILGHDVTVLAPTFLKDTPSWNKNDSYNIIRVDLSYFRFIKKYPTLFRVVTAFFYPLFTLAHWNKLHNLQIDIIQAEHLFSLPTAYILKYLLKSKVIFDDPILVENELIRRGNNYLAYFVRVVEKFLFKRCDVFIYTSEKSRQYLLNRMVDGEMYYIPNGVDTSNFTPDTNTRKSQHNLRIFFNCSLYADQNVQAVLNAINISDQLYKLCDSPFETCIICGPLDLLPVEYLDFEIVKNGIVKIHTNVDDIVKSINNADITILPYSRDHNIEGGNRLKALEYLACEKIVLTTPEGIEGVLGLSNGFHLIILNSIEDFALKLNEIVENPDEYIEVGINGKKFIESNYTWTKLIGKYIF